MRSSASGKKHSASVGLQRWGNVKSLFESFKANRERTPDATAFMIAAGDRSIPIRWRQFADDIEAIAWVIRRYAPGRTIGLLGENSYEWITGHAACVFSGATVVPIEVNLSAAEIAERLKFTDAVALIHSALYTEKAKEVKRLVPGIVIGGFGAIRTDFFIDQGRRALASGEAGIFSLPPPDEDRTSMIVFTSGTTSRPHGAELTLKGMATFAAYTQTRLKMKLGDRSLMVLPLHHIFGVCTTYLMLAEGVALGVCPDFRRLYDTVERFRANYIFLVPALAEILAEKIAQRAPSAEAAFGSPIDWILVGGAPLPRRTYENLAALGIQALGGYGLTETASLYSIATYGDDPRVGSAGRACDLPGVETKVSEDGILMIRGPNVMKGYYREPERTAKVLSPDGWFNTGDIGRIDGDGYVWITGRASRTIVLSSGKKIAPEELEARVLALPGVREVVVSGNGETREICAEIFAVIPEATLRREVTALNGNLPVYKRIKTVIVRSEPFPRTASGKICLGGNASSPVAADPEVSSAPIPSRRPAPKRRMRLPLVFAFVLALAAIAVAVLGLVPTIFEHFGIVVSDPVNEILEYIDLAGEILLGFFALVFLLRARDRYR